MPFFQPGLWGDALLQTVVFAAPGNLFVLQRPVRAQRVLLIVVNDLAAAVIRVNFDNPATVGIGVAIGPGGNLFFDAVVPQNDINIFSPAAGQIHVAWLNVDATNPSRVLTNVS